MKDSSKDLSLMIITVLTIIMTVVGVTLAYFTTKINQNNAVNGTVDTAKIGNITFDGGNDFSNNTDIEPGWKQSKTFTISAPATDVTRTVYVRLDYTNNFQDLTWSLSGTGANSSITGKVPAASTSTTVTLVTLTISPSSSAQTFNYTFTLELPDNNTNQNYDQGKSFNGTLYADLGEGVNSIYYNNNNKTGTTTNLNISDNYNKLDYIASTGTQFIDTGYVMTSNIEKVYIDYEKTNVGSNVSLCGAEKNNTTSANRSFTIIPHGTTNSSLYVGAGSSGISIPSSLNTRYQSTIDARNLKVTASTTKVNDGTVTNNNTSYSQSNGEFTVVNHSINIFGNHTSSKNGDQLASMKLYAFKLWDNDVLVRDYIPVKRKSDSAIGLLDLVSMKFYANAGSGVFTTGNVISD